jgi:hypothetical protein
MESCDTMTELPLNEVEIFWGEIAPCEHMVQIYENDVVFLDALETFVGAGLRAGETVVVIGTSLHLNALEDRLQAGGFDLIAALAQDQYIPLDAEVTLSKFMVNNWPDEVLFEKVVGEILARARHGGRRVRAFGEMVALMWHRGWQGATVRLEHLWHRLCQKEAFPLLCAYPRSGFTENAVVGMKTICEAHSKVVRGRRGLQTLSAA